MVPTKTVEMLLPVVVMVVMEGMVVSFRLGMEVQDHCQVVVVVVLKKLHYPETEMEATVATVASYSPIHHVLDPLFP